MKRFKNLENGINFTPSKPIITIETKVTFTYMKEQRKGKTS